jgi:hypothetical protein
MTDACKYRTIESRNRGGYRIRQRGPTITVELSERELRELGIELILQYGKPVRLVRDQCQHEHVTKDAPVMMDRYYCDDCGEVLYR